MPDISREDITRAVRDAVQGVLKEALGLEPGHKVRPLQTKQETKAAPENLATRLHLREYLHVVSKHKWWVVGCVVVGLLIGTVAAFSKEETYVAQATLMLARTDSLQQGKDYVGWGQGGYRFLNTMRGVMTSREVAEHAIRRLRKADVAAYNREFQQRPGPFSLMWAKMRRLLDRSVPAEEPSREGPAPAPPRPSPRTAKTSADQGSPSARYERFVRYFTPVKPLNLMLAGVCRLAGGSSPAVPEAKADQAPKRIPYERVVTYLGRIKPITSAGTALITIQTWAYDRQMAAEMANVHAEEFVKYYNDTRRHGARDTLKWLQDRHEEYTKRVGDAQKKILDFEEKGALILVTQSAEQGIPPSPGLNVARGAAPDGRIRPSQGQTIMGMKVSILMREFLAAQKSHVDNELLYEAVRRHRQEGKPLDTFPEIRDDAHLEGYRVRLVEAQKKVEELAKTYGPKNMKYVAALKEMEALQTTLVRETEKFVAKIENRYRKSADRERIAHALVAEAIAEATKLTQKNQELLAHKRDLAKSQRLLESIMSRIQSVDLTSRAGQSNLSILETASPPPNSTKVPQLKLISMGGLSGFAAGIIMAFFISYWQGNRVQSPEEIESLLGVPVLGLIVPMAPGGRLDLLRSSRDAVPGSDAGRPVAPERRRHGRAQRALIESFRRIRTSLISRANGRKVLMLTSTVPEEGKTSIAANLAQALAESGARVLLVDADTRRPKLHRLLLKGFLRQSDRPGETASKTSAWVVLCDATRSVWSLLEPVITWPFSMVTKVVRRLIRLLPGKWASKVGYYYTYADKGDSRPTKGLLTFLSGDDGFEDGIIKKTVLEQVWLTPSGQLPKGTKSSRSELLASPAMDDFLAQARARYDYVLVDTPPAAVVTDPLIVAPKCDGVIWVSYCGKTPDRPTARCRQEMDEQRAEIIGAVFNAVPPVQSSYGYYGYYYYYYYDREGRKKHGRRRQSVPRRKRSKQTRPPAEAL